MRFVSILVKMNSRNLPKTNERSPGNFLGNISYLDLETYRNKLKNTLTKHGTIRTDATVNRTMACLSHMIAKAVEWDMLDRNPFDKGRSLQLKENNRRLRYLTEEEIERLLAECFKSIKKRQILGTEYIFCDQKGHIRDIRTAFNAALKRARILDFRPYDLRHTFASHYLMRGGSLRALQNILGHKDLKMTMRYAHLSKEFAKEEIKLLDGLTSGKKKEDGHKMVTSSLSEKAASS